MNYYNNLTPYIYKSCAKNYFMKTFLEYPNVTLIRLERYGLPLDERFPNRDPVLYTDRTTDLANQLIPLEIERAFYADLNKETLIIDGCLWERAEDLDEGMYVLYNKTVLDIREILQRRIDEYFNTLEQHMGTNVKTREIIPNLEILAPSVFRFPETFYILKIQPNADTSDFMLTKATKNGVVNLNLVGKLFFNS